MTSKFPQRTGSLTSGRAAETIDSSEKTEGKRSSCDVKGWRFCAELGFHHDQVLAAKMIKLRQMNRNDSNVVLG